MANNNPVQPVQVGYSSVGIYNGPIPREGPKDIPISLDFSIQNTYQIDFTLIQQRGLISELQAVYIDNSLNASSVSLIVNGSNQKIVSAANSQGFYPILAPNPPKFTSQSIGGVAVQMHFLNIPITCLTWNTQNSTFNFTGSGYLNTSDVALDALIAGGTLPVSPKKQGQNDTLVPDFVGDDLFTGSTATTVAQTIIAGNPGFYFTFCDVEITPDAILGSAGELTVTLKDGATTIAQGICYLPASLGTITLETGPSVLIRLDNLQYNAKAGSNNLTLTLGTALTGGKVYWNVAGGQTAVIGP